MKMHFKELFEINNGSITPKIPVSLGGITMTAGVLFGMGVQFSGIDLAQHTNSYFDVENQNGLHVIKGIFQ